MTGIPLFTAERPEALWLIGPTSDTPWTWPPDAFTPVAPLSRQPYSSSGRGFHIAGWRRRDPFGSCETFIDGRCTSTFTVPRTGAADTQHKRDRRSRRQ